MKDSVGQYQCHRCHVTYPIVDGVLRFLPGISEQERQIKNSFNTQHLRYMDSRYLHFEKTLIDQWLSDVRLPRDYFQNKLVLDAGCGTGRWTYAMALLGARVVAVDFTEAGVAVTQEGTGPLENVAVIQANIFHLPFPDDTFDFVVSWGVLHHTPNTKSAFDRLVPLVKKGGQLYVMVYEKHNPGKFFWTDLLRRCFRLVSEERRYQLCKFLVIRNRILLRILKDRIICSFLSKAANSSQISTLQLGLYDAYSPKFNHLHTRQEVQQWFHESQFIHTVLTKPVLYTQEKDILFSGECGGSINMRGTKT